MVRISTRQEVTFEHRPKGQEWASPLEGWEEHSGRWEADVQYLGLDIAMNASVVVGNMSFLQLFIICCGRIQKWLPPKTVISILIYYASLSASLELLISSSATTSSQDLSEGWLGLQFRVPKALSEQQNAFHLLLTLLHAIHQLTAGTSQAFNSTESFSRYKLLSFTVIFYTLFTWLASFETLD